MPDPLSPQHSRRLDRARGCLLGLALGEALGRPLDGLGSQQARAAIAGRPALGSGLGDQTAMALLVGESIVDLGRFDPAEAARRLEAWARAAPRDIGRVAARALFLVGQGAPWPDAARIAWEEAQPRGATAEGLVRGVPLALLSYEEEQALARDSLAAAALTHFDPRCRWSAAALNLMVARLVRGQGQGLPGAIVGLVGERHVLRLLEEVPTLVYAQLRGANEALQVLRSATWLALNADDFADAALRAVGLGGPTALLGAAVGALAGARFGASALPSEWLEQLGETRRLATLAERLAERAPRPPSPRLELERRNGPRAEG